MSTAEILEQLPRLTARERDTVRSRLDEIDAHIPASPEEQRLITERVAAYRKNPGAGLSWNVAEADIRRQAGL